ncbi:MAG: hypothetical protein IPG53_20455 [Ignavibacteriales bacterium]|nr:hypothetical protein [Ignavibacteriales bacterium]
MHAVLITLIKGRKIESLNVHFIVVLRNFHIILLKFSELTWKLKTKISYSHNSVIIVANLRVSLGKVIGDCRKELAVWCKHFEKFNYKNSKCIACKKSALDLNRQ